MRIHKVLIFCLFVSLVGVGLVVIHKPTLVRAAGGPSQCITDPIDLGVEKRLLPLPSECKGSDYCGRGEQKTGPYSPSPGCVTPKKIIMHTTQGKVTADATYDYFAEGSSEHTGSHFTIGNDGKILQMVEMGKTQVEYAQAVGPTQDHISIEMGSPTTPNGGNFNSKSEMPDAQYQSALHLVKTLMDTYNIPLTDGDNDARYGSNDPISGVFGHYNFYGPGGDPGVGWMKDFRVDLATATGLTGGTQSSTPGSSSGSRTSTSCVITKVGAPSAPPPALPASCAASGSTGGTGGPCQTPPQPYPADLKQEMISKWGITFDGYDDQHLTWAYEELYAIQNTKFLSLVKDAIIQATSESISTQVGCPSKLDPAVRLHPYEESGFKLLISHELTHTLQWCQPEEASHFSEVSDAITGEGYVSNYSQTACLGGITQENEDYADTVAYYLNPNAPQFTCGDGLLNPYLNGAHPLHKALAEKIVGTYSCNE